MPSAQTGAVPDTQPGRDPDILTAAEVADRLHIKYVQTVRDAAAAGIIPGLRTGHQWRFSWRAVYAAVAGPGIPDGEIVDSRQLARRLGPGVSDRWVRRAAAPPGTPDKLPGLRIGAEWRFAMEAVRAALGAPGR